MLGQACTEPFDIASPERTRRAHERLVEGLRSSGSLTELQRTFPLTLNYYLVKSLLEAQNIDDSSSLPKQVPDVGISGCAKGGGEQATAVGKLIAMSFGDLFGDAMGSK